EPLATPGQRALVGRAANVDVDDEARGIAVGEPGGAAGAFPHDIALRGRGQHGLRQSAALEIAPGIRAASQLRAPGPSLSDRDWRAALVARAVGRREIGSNPGQGPQHLPHLAEVETRLEMLDGSEDVALGVTVRVPPPCPATRDNDDLASRAAVFEAALRAFLAIEKPWGRRLLEHGRAVDAGAQLLNLSLRVLHLTSPCLAQGGPLRPFHVFLRSPTGRTARRPRRKGARNAREPATDPCDGGGDSGRRALASRSFPMALRSLR